MSLSRSMWDLVPWLGNKPGPPALRAWSLSHWTMKDTPKFVSFWPDYPRCSLSPSPTWQRQEWFLVSFPWRRHCSGLPQFVTCCVNLWTGIEPTGNMVKQPAKFTVDTISAGQGDVMVFVEDPEGNKEEVCWRRLPLSVSHGTSGSYNRARDCVSVFLIKAHSKSFSFLFFF